MTLDEWKAQARVGDICRLDEVEPARDDMIVMRIGTLEFLFVNLTTRQSRLFDEEVLYRSNLLRADEPVTPAELVYKG